MSTSKRVYYRYIYYKALCCFRRKYKQTVAEAPPEIRTIFNRYSEDGVMSAHHFQRFLIDHQGEENTTEEDAQAIIDNLKFFKHRKSLNLDGFFKYLFGDLNPPLPHTSEPYHDMTAPLSEYFIYTGHNSYLTGNQLSSDCSDAPIVEALRRGVRGIELDMWPNSTNDNVDVVHGRTLTTPVELIKCLQSIKEHAFFASPYPVVVTLEDHLRSDLQDKVAKMVTQTFGGMLFCPGSEGLKELPSPDSLKKQIIISTKPPKKHDERNNSKEKDDGAQKEKKSTEEDTWGREIADPKNNAEKQIIISTKRPKKHDERNNSKEKDDDAQKEKKSTEEDTWGREIADPKNDAGMHDQNYHDEAEDHQYEEDIDYGERKTHHNSETEYHHLIAIHAGKPRGGLREALRIDPNKVRRISMSELELEKAMITHATDIVRFTQKNLLRIYPKSTRVDSSNYNPIIGWMHGAQMVAFNMQGYGRPLWLMHGMFRANAGCGYVKKPDFLRKIGPNDPVFDPRVSRRMKKILKVRVYMGDGWHLDFGRTHFDAYSPPDFYTKIGIAGVPADHSAMKKTKIIEDDWTPVWDEEFAFPLTVPELALLRIEVHEYDVSERDDFGGQTCLPVWELKTGIRAVPLFDRKGMQYRFVKLLMSFQFV